MTSVPEPPSRAEAEGVPDLDLSTGAQRATGQDESDLEVPHDTAMAGRNTASTNGLEL